MICEKHFWRIFAPAARQLREPRAFQPLAPSSLSSLSEHLCCASEPLLQPFRASFQKPPWRGRNSLFPDYPANIHIIIYLRKQIFIFQLFNLFLYSFLHIFMLLFFYTNISLHLYSFILMFFSLFMLMFLYFFVCIFVYLYIHIAFYSFICLYVYSFSIIIYFRMFLFIYIFQVWEGSIFIYTLKYQEPKSRQPTTNLQT